MGDRRVLTLYPYLLNGTCWVFDDESRLPKTRRSMHDMSETPYRLPLHIDTGALAFDVYAVLDLDYQLVQEFDTEAEAEAFVAKANGWDIETVRRNTADHGRMLAEYRENLIRGGRERHKE